MESDLGLGPLNGHAVGRILKEAVRRASVAIHSERFLFTHESKQGYSGAMDDVVTNADRKAQEIYLRTFRECFPRCGVIAEEEEESFTEGCIYGHPHDGDACECYPG